MQDSNVFGQYSCAAVFLKPHPSALTCIAVSSEERARAYGRLASFAERRMGEMLMSLMGDGPILKRVPESFGRV